MKYVTTEKKKEPPVTGAPRPETYDEFLSVLGPERNIVLPGTGDEALRRLLSVKGQDPYWYENPVLISRIERIVSINNLCIIVWLVF